MITNQTRQNELNEILTAIEDARDNESMFALILAYLVKETDEEERKVNKSISPYLNNLRQTWEKQVRYYLYAIKKNPNGENKNEFNEFLNNFRGDILMYGGFTTNR